MIISMDIDVNKLNKPVDKRKIINSDLLINDDVHVILERRYQDDTLMIYKNLMWYVK